MTATRKEKRMKDQGVCHHCHNSLCIHKVPIFSSLNDKDLVKIFDVIKHKEYKKGESIFRVGDRLNAMIIINDGSAKAVKYTPEGREQILHVFLEGDFFGEKYLLSNETASYAVEALKDTKVCMLMKDDFHELLQKHPEIAIEIITELGNRMSHLEETIKSMGVRSVDARIGELLIEYANKQGKKVPDGILIPLPLSREGIANYLGIARETLSRKLSNLESERIIKSIGNKNILLLNEEELKIQLGIFP